MKTTYQQHNSLHMHVNNISTENVKNSVFQTSPPTVKHTDRWDKLCLLDTFFLLFCLQFNCFHGAVVKENNIFHATVVTGNTVSCNSCKRKYSFMQQL